MIRKVVVSRPVLGLAVWMLGNSGDPQRLMQASAEPVRLRLVEGGRMGGTSAPPDAQFSTATLLSESPEGLIVVVDGRERRLHIFDSFGKHLARVGRHGGGPAEFEIISGIGFLADTIYVIDFGNRRTSLLSRDGQELARVRYEPDGPVRSTTGLRAAFPEVLLRDSTALGKARAPREAVQRGTITHEPVLRMTRSGKVVDTVVWTKTHANAPMRGAGGSSIAQPFEDATLIAISPRIGRSILVERRAATSSSARRFSVASISPAGDTLFNRSYEYAPQRLTTDMLQKAIAPLLEAGRKAGYAESEILAAVKKPSFLPPVSRVVAGADGSVWLERSASGSAMARWWILKRDGSLAGSVDMPGHLKILFARENRVWTVDAETFELPVVIKYEIRR